MIRVAVYGKGGIGKSTTVSNPCVEQYDTKKGPQGPFLFSARLFHVEHFSAFIYLFYVEH